MACGTGVGCIASPEAVVVGGAEIAAGGYVAVHGGIGLGKNLAQMSANKSGGNRTEGHHPWPKYLLGPEKQELYHLDPEMHSRYHSELDRYLSRKYGQDYYEKIFDTTKKRNDLLESLLDFNKDFDETYDTHTYETLEDVLKDEDLLPK